MGKLVRVLRYIRGTLYLPLIIRDDSLNIIKWWVYASFVAHPDRKGPTGAIVSMGSGSIMELSQNQKMNGMRSMEAEIVGADHALPQCLWSRYFIEGQGYVVEDIDFHKDNMSAMLMENNSK